MYFVIARNLEVICLRCLFMPPDTYDFQPGGLFMTFVKWFVPLVDVLWYAYIIFIGGSCGLGSCLNHQTVTFRLVFILFSTWFLGGNRHAAAHAERSKKPQLP